MSAIAFAGHDQTLQNELARRQLDDKLLLNDYGEVSETGSTQELVKQLSKADKEHLNDYEHVVPYLINGVDTNRETLDQKTKKIGGSGCYDGCGVLSGSVITNIPAKQIRLDTYKKDKNQGN